MCTGTEKFIQPNPGIKDKNGMEIHLEDILNNRYVVKFGGFYISGDYGGDDVIGFYLLDTENRGDYGETIPFASGKEYEITGNQLNQ